MFLTEQLGWAVGDSLRIVHTTDGGQSWILQQHIPSRHVLVTIDMLDASHGFASGTAGTLFATTDGAAWRPVPINATHPGARQQRLALRLRWQVVWNGDDTITHIERSPAGELWLCGTRGMILRRDPDGAWVAFGDGCTGSAGVATLAATAPPRLAQTLTLQATNLSAQATVAALLAGGSRTTRGSFRLPLDMSLFGMNGCSAERTDRSVPRAPSWHVRRRHWCPAAGRAPRTAGNALHLQVLAPDPAANPAGMVLANAGTAWVGR